MLLTSVHHNGIFCGSAHSRVKETMAAISLPPHFECITFSGAEKPDLLDEIGALRVRVWEATGVEQTLPLIRGLWLDEADNLACHFAIRHHGSVVAASRLNLYREFAEIPDAAWYTSLKRLPPFPLAEITRLVVSPDYQRQKLGTVLDEECIAIAKTRNAQCVFCDVPEYRMSHLTRRGFQMIQEPKLGIRFPTIRWAVMFLDLQKQREEDA